MGEVEVTFEQPVPVSLVIVAQLLAVVVADTVVAVEVAEILSLLDAHGSVGVVEVRF